MAWARVELRCASAVMMMMLMTGADTGNYGDDGSAGQKQSKRVAVGRGLRLTGIAGVGEKTEEEETCEEEQEHRPEAESCHPWRSRTALRTRG